MVSEKLLDIERAVIGDSWQNNAIHANMLYMADELGSRFAGTESETHAQRYLVDTFKEYGYDDAQADPFTYWGWKRGPVTLSMLTPKRRDFPAIALALSPGGTVEGEVVDLGTGSPEEFDARDRTDVQGKIVLCSSATSPSGKRVHRRTKYGLSVNYGAVGFIFANHNPEQLAPTGSLRSAYRMGGEIPGIGVSYETGAQMRRLAKDEPFTVRFTDASTLIPDSVSVNIIADLPGATKEWIVVGGHYDGHDIAQGAMDNLSAVAVMLEVARALKPYRGTLHRGIRFIAFGCEEIGVTGSTCYVDLHQDEIPNIALMVNLELGSLAWKDGTQHAAFMCQPPALEALLTTFSREIKYPTTIVKGLFVESDHMPFLLQGVPTIMMGGEPSPQLMVIGRGWGHTSADTMDKVDPRNLQEGAMVLARLLVRLAGSDAPIAKHTPREQIIKTLEALGRRKVLEIQKKWHPESVR